MKRRTILTGLGGLGFAGLAAVFFRGRDGTQVVSDDDDTTVHKSDDEDDSTSPEGPKVTDGEKDDKDETTRIEVEFGKKASLDRVNSDSTSVFDDVFFICNRGKEPASVWLEAEPIENERGDPAVRFHPERKHGKSFVGRKNAVEIPSKTCHSVSVTTATYGISADTTLVDRVLVRTHRKG